MRQYDARPVRAEDILSCVEAARLAPSACNSQPWRFVVVVDPALLPVARDAAVGMPIPINAFAREAPVIVAVVAEKPKFTAAMGGVAKGHGYVHLDIGMAVSQFCLQAAALGLGTCILGWFNERAIKKLLGIPPSRHVPLLITLGHPGAHLSKRDKKRKPLDEAFSMNRY